MTKESEKTRVSSWDMSGTDPLARRYFHEREYRFHLGVGQWIEVKIVGSRLEVTSNSQLEIQAHSSNKIYLRDR